MSERTPNGFVFVNVKIIIFFKHVDKLNILNDFILCMSKRTETFIIAFLDIIWVKLTELSFIAIWMVQLLKFVMWKLANLVIAFLFSTNKMVVFNIWGSSFVFVIVEIETCFSLMGIFFYGRNTFVQTLYGFESSNVESKELPVLKMIHVIGVDQWAIEASLTISLLRALIDFIG